jgi:hypothetical protein
MKTDNRSEYVARDGILKLLSDEEVARVSSAETATRLAEGDEYFDLEHLELGVRVAVEGAAPMRRVLPRKAVQEATWTKILSQLKASPPAAAVPPRA